MKYALNEIIPVEDLPHGADYQLANSFANFLYKTWHELGFGDPTPNNYAMAKFLQYGGDRSQMLAFRGAAKSYITGPFTDWCLYRDPNCQVLTTSATGAFAAANARFAHTLVHSFDWLAHMRPSHNQATSTADWDVRGVKPAKGTSYASRSITGQITGLRADVIISDDAETPNTSSTPGARSELRHRLSEFGGAIIKPGGKIVYLGTPQCEETIYKDNEVKGYETLIIPIVYPTPEEIVKYGRHRLAPHILEHLEENPGLAGTSTEPTRFTEADIAQRQIEWGGAEFRRQFKMFMDAGDDSGQPLKLRNLVVMDLQPHHPLIPDTGVPAQLQPAITGATPIDLLAEGVNIDSLSEDQKIYAPAAASMFQKPDETIMWVDPSGAGTDETSWAVTALKSARVFLLSAKGRLEGYTEDTLMAIALDAKKWGVGTIYVEQEMGAGMFASLLKPILKEIKHPCTVEAVSSGKKSKEARIIANMEPLTTTRRLVVNLDIFRVDNNSARYSAIQESKQRFYRFTYQYTRIKDEKGCLPKDDRIDAVAAACGHWTDRLEIETKEAEEQHMEEYMAEQLRLANEGAVFPIQDIKGDLEKFINETGPYANKVSHNRY